MQDLPQNVEPPTVVELLPAPPAGPGRRRATHVPVERQREVVRAILAGKLNQRDAARACGVHESTVHKWRKRHAPRAGPAVSRGWRTAKVRAFVAWVEAHRKRAFAMTVPAAVRASGCAIEVSTAGKLMRAMGKPRVGRWPAEARRRAEERA